MTASEKVAYLKGLMEGMSLDKDTNEGKLFAAIADILESLALDVEELDANADDLAEEIDALSEDLSDVEDIVYADDDDEDELPGCGRCCGYDEDEDEDDEDPLFFDVTCPACNKTITIDEDVVALGSIQCPNCGEMLEFDGIDDGEDEENE
jgi:ribosomal protein S27E